MGNNIEPYEEISGLRIRIKEIQLKQKELRREWLNLDIRLTPLKRRLERLT